MSRAVYSLLGVSLSLTHTHTHTHTGIEQRDRHVAARIQFQIGDKCQVRLPEGQNLEGEITSLDVTQGCHNVSYRRTIQRGVVNVEAIHLKVF